jgi:hypothetical protein
VPKKQRPGGRIRIDDGSFVRPRPERAQNDSDLGVTPTGSEKSSARAKTKRRYITRSSLRHRAITHEGPQQRVHHAAQRVGAVGIAAIARCVWKAYRRIASKGIRLRRLEIISCTGRLRIERGEPVIQVLDVARPPSRQLALASGAFHQAAQRSSDSAGRLSSRDSASGPQCSRRRVYP